MEDTNTKRNQVICAIAVIFDVDGRILIAKRHDPLGPTYHNKWGLPAGMVDMNEHPAEAARREAKEEVGVDIELTHPYPVVRSMFDVERQHHVVLLAYPAKVVGGEIDFSMDPGTADAKWMAYDEIEFTEGLPFLQEFIDEAKMLHNKQV